MKVLNIGSMNLDHVYNVDHIILPGETQATTGLNLFLGGKGMNQSIALAKAGVEVYHGGMIGKDGYAFIDEMWIRDRCIGMKSGPLMPPRQAADAAASVWLFSVTKPAFIRFLLRLPHAVWY